MYEKTLNIYNNDNYYEIKKVNPILLKRLKKVENKNALDVGCGRGENAIFMKKKGYNVTALDINKNVLKFIENHNIKTNLTDIRNFNFVKKYDLITSFYSLQHILEAEAKTFLEKAINNLNIDALLIIAIFENRKNAIDKKSLLRFFQKKSYIKLLFDKTWQREDLEHGKKHIHKGYYCIYRKERDL